MEKYRKFADNGTGVNPFIPVHFASPRHEHALSRYLRISVLGLFLVIRVPLFAVLFALTALTDILFMVPVVSEILVRPIIRPLIAYLTLVIMGLPCSVPSGVEDFRRLKMKRPSDSPLKPSITLSTFHGYVDVLVHAISTRPSAFAFIALDGKFTICYSIISGLLTATKSPLPAGTTTIVPSNSLLFANASPTNGLGILKLDIPTLSVAISNRPFQIAKIQYQSSYGPHHLVSSPFSHLIDLMLGNWFGRASVFKLPEPVTNAVQIPGLLARLTPAAVETEVEQKTFLEFKQYWTETQNVSYVKKKL